MKNKSKKLVKEQKAKLLALAQKKGVLRINTDTIDQAITFLERYDLERCYLPESMYGLLK